MAEPKEPERVRLLTLPAVKDLLEREQEMREELTYEQKLSLDHAVHFVRQPTEDAEKLAQALLALGGRVADYHAYRIADLLPTHEDDVRAIFARDRSSPDADEIAKILAVVQEHL